MPYLQRPRRHERRHKRFNPPPSQIESTTYYTASQPVRDLVFGFINDCQLALPATNPYFDIPDNVYFECLRFFRNHKTHRHYDELTTRCLILRDPHKREQSLA